MSELTLRRDDDGWYADSDRVAEMSDPFAVFTRIRLRRVRLSGFPETEPEPGDQIVCDRDVSVWRVQAETPAAFAEVGRDLFRVPVPAPSARRGTRLEWRNGAWCKRTSKGWVLA